MTFAPTQIASPLLRAAPRCIRSRDSLQGLFHFAGRGVAGLRDDLVLDGLAFVVVDAHRLVQADRLALVGTPIHWEAVVRNASETPLENLEATWLIDGKPGGMATSRWAPR